MGDIVFFLLLGLGIGSLYAMLGAGLVVVFKGSGVINFAHGAMAMYGAFTFDELWRQGALQLPWVDFLPGDVNVPVRIGISDEGLPLVVALLGAFAMAVALGLAVHFLVFRPLRNAAPLGKVVGSLGVMLFLQGVALLNFGTSFRQPRGVLPDEAVQDFLGLGQAFPRNALYSAAIALAIGVALYLVYRHTRFGLATRAAAGNQKGAVLLGYSPEYLASVNWVIASVLATAAAIIVGPIQGTLTPVGLTAVVVPALGAALIGGLSSIMIATLGGLGLGAVQALLGFYANREWFPDFLRTGVREAVPLIVIAAVLFLRGKNLPVRGAVEERRLPLSPYPVRVTQHAVVWSVIVVVAAFVFTGKWSYALSTALIAGILLLSVVVVTGYVGQISLAQLSLAGVAAFFMARMMADGSTTSINPFAVSGPGLPWPVAALLAVVVSVVVGVLLGLPALRIRGVQLAVVTLAAAISLQTLYLENDVLTGLRAGAAANITAPTFFGIDIGAVNEGGLTDRPAFTIFCLVVLVGCAVLVANVRRSGTGRRFLAVRANERAAAAAGIGVTQTKLLAFGIGSALAGISGVMFGFQQSSVSSASFVYGLGLAYLAFAYLGGITSINGAILAGLLVPSSMAVIFSNHYFHGTNLESYAVVMGGAGLVVTAIIHPEGIAPFFQPMLRYLGSWLVNARGSEWAAAVRHFAPWVVGGAVAGYIVWPLRVDSYSPIWMPLVGVYATLVVRAIVLQIYRAVTGKQGGMHAKVAAEHAAVHPAVVPARETVAAGVAPSESPS